MPTARARLALIGGFVAVGCYRSGIPDPRVAAQEYAHAAERADADAIYGMLTRDAQRAYGTAGTRRLVADSRKELVRQGGALASPGSKVSARARVRFADGEQVELEIENGAFKLSSAGTLPAGAHSPVQALDELRQALARRSYASLLRVLSNEKKSALEGDMRSLVSGLEQPDTLDVKVNGDTAEVQVPGGHFVKLKREAGIWRVEDFD